MEIFKKKNLSSDNGSLYSIEGINKELDNLERKLRSLDITNRCNLHESIY